MSPPTVPEMLRQVLLVALVLTMGACQKTGDALLVVKVTTNESFENVKRLDVVISTLAEAGKIKQDTLAYALPDGGSIDLSRTPIVLGVTLASDIGDVAVTVRAIGADPIHPLASGTQAPVTPHAGGKTLVEILLIREASADGGTSDAPADGAGAAGASGDAREGGAGGLDAPHPGRYTDNGDGTITDNLAGLMWQQVVERTFDQTTGVFTQSQAVAYCPMLILGTHRDWRLPSIMELGSIVDDQKYSPSIDAVFGARPPDAFWSSTPLVGAPSSAWTVSFLSGSQNYAERSALLYARCVRGEASASGTPYTTGAQTVSDSRTKLTWQRTAPSIATWPNAKGYCQSQGVETLLGGTGWRLPTRRELLTLVDTTRSKPSIDLIFPAPTVTDFWSSTPFAGPGFAAWKVNFDFGTSEYNPTTTPYAVRCVR
jgi:Protein of unknown function (DUF1566)